MAELSGGGLIHRGQGKENPLAKFKRKAFVIRSYDDLADRSASGAEMKRVLGAFDLILLGIGCIVGTGIMVLTGVAAREYAGPGVMLSYALAAVASMLTSFAYAEFAADIPIAGGSFNYVGLTFGEFAAWVAACDLILEYTLSAAAVAKGFTPYFASLLGADLNKMRFQAGVFILDPLAALMVVGVSLMLARSTRDSSVLNSAIVALHMALIVFVLAAGFPNVDPGNYTPFLPFGMRGVFSGASVVMFSYIGYETMTTAAEEVKNPPVDLPIGIIGALSISSVLYMLMCLVITGMQPFQRIDLHAPFGIAFREVGMGWAEKIVSAGALAGIMTSLTGSLLGQARIYVTLGRQHLLPAWLARVSPSSGTPRNATLLTMVTAGLLALFFDIDTLAELVSIGTLVVFTMVSAGVIFRRYHSRVDCDDVRPIAIRFAVLVASSIAASLTYTEQAPGWVPAVFLVLWAAGTASFHWLPVRYTPALFRCPGQPWVPSMAMLSCLHLIGSLGWPAYVRWVIWFTLGTAVYVSYSMHHSQGEGNSRSGQGIALGDLQPVPVRSESSEEDVVAPRAWLLGGAGGGGSGRSGARGAPAGVSSSSSSGDDGSSPAQSDPGGPLPAIKVATGGSGEFGNGAHRRAAAATPKSQPGEGGGGHSRAGSRDSTRTIGQDSTGGPRNSPAPSGLGRAPTTPTGRGGG